MLRKENLQPIKYCSNKNWNLTFFISYTLNKKQLVTTHKFCRTIKVTIIVLIVQSYIWIKSNVNLFKFLCYKGSNSTRLFWKSFKSDRIIPLSLYTGIIAMIVLNFSREKGEEEVAFKLYGKCKMLT